jgi:DNA phosphorothioation-dependent restriction protein DptG
MHITRQTQRTRDKLIHCAELRLQSRSLLPTTHILFKMQELTNHAQSYPQFQCKADNALFKQSSFKSLHELYLHLHMCQVYQIQQWKFATSNQQPIKFLV